MDKKKFVTTITGADMKIFFGFREIFLQKSSSTSPKELANKFVWVDVGTAIQVRYSMQRPAQQKYTIDNLDAIGIAKGIRISSGDIIFKNFNQDSVYYIQNKIKEVLSNRLNQSTPVTSEQEGYADIYQGNKVNDNLSESDLTEFFDNEINNWDQIPYFDIMILSKSDEFDANGILSMTRINDVKVTDLGSSESIDSTEINDIVKFVAVGGIESWKQTTAGLGGNI